MQVFWWVNAVSERASVRARERETDRQADRQTEKGRREKRKPIETKRVRARTKAGGCSRVRKRNICQLLASGAYMSYVLTNLD